MLVKNFKGALQPKFDSRKSFYGKAEFEELATKGGNKIYLLYSYKSLVCSIIQEKDQTKWLYLNSNINKALLTSQTTLRHIKEFTKQFYKNQEYTKAELLKLATLKNFNYIEIHETNAHDEQISIADERNYYLTTSPETRNFFKGFKGYKERKKQDSKGKYLYTSSIYGYSNYYFYYFN